MSVAPRPDTERIRSALMSQFAAAPTEAGPRPWPEFTAELMSLYQPPARARATCDQVRRTLRYVAALIGPDGTTADLTMPLVQRFIAALPPGMAPITIRSELNRLRTVCSYAAGMGYVRVNPFSLRRSWVRVPIRPSDRVRHHSLDDIGRVLELARREANRKRRGVDAQWRARRLLVVVTTAAHTGMRRNEILCLKVEDVDVPRRLLSIVPRDQNRLKTEKSAGLIPMTEVLAAVVAEWLPHLELPAEATAAGLVDAGYLIPNTRRTGPWLHGRRGVQPVDRLKQLGERCGVPGLTFQSLRHSFATHAGQAWGMTEEQIRRILRHATTRTQVHYKHADAANLRDMVRGVNFGPASSAGGA